MIKKGEKGSLDLLKEGLIEYLDVNESDNAIIAFKEENVILKTL